MHDQQVQIRLAYENPNKSGILKGTDSRGLDFSFFPSNYFWSIRGTPWTIWIFFLEILWRYSFSETNLWGVNEKYLGEANFSKNKTNVIQIWY